MAQKKVYDNEFKIQAVKLGIEIVFSKAAKNRASMQTLFMGGISAPKMPGWIWARVHQTPDSAMSLNEEVQKTQAAEQRTSRQKKSTV